MAGYLGRQPGAGIRSLFEFTAAGGETSLSGSDDNGKTLRYADGKYVDVFLNGTLLTPGDDYTATTRTSIDGFSPALDADDIVVVMAYDVFAVANHYTKDEVDADFLADDDLAANGGTIPQADRNEHISDYWTFEARSIPDDVLRLANADNGHGVRFRFTSGPGISLVPQDINGNPLWDKDFRYDFGSAFWRMNGPLVGGSPAGESKGNGTANFEAVYDDGTQLSDYVFDKYLGRQTYEYTDEVREHYGALDESWFDPAQDAAYWR